MYKDRIKNNLLLTLSSIIIGIICGLSGTFFHSCTEIANKIRVNNSWLVYLLPISGLAIVWLYKRINIPPETRSKPIFIGARTGEKINPLLSVGVFFATCVTHLFGGSTGRESAALQVGGSLGSLTGQILKFDRKNNRIAIICGMAAGFTSMFGTPITSAIFAVEATDVALGMFYTCNFIYIIISVFIATVITSIFGFHGMKFSIPEFDINANNVIVTVLIAIVCAAMAVVFILGKKYVKKCFSKYIKNDYLKIFVGGVIIVILSIIWNSGDYNGVGTNVITNAIAGNVKPEAFFVKLIFTIISLSVGFKGGELVPLFFIGATLGGLLGGILGVSIGIGAAIGLICIFSAATDCPITAIVLGVEMFGFNLLPYFIITCLVAYFVSGNIDFYDKKNYKPEDLANL